jgi:hypothetical protein
LTGWPPELVGDFADTLARTTQIGDTDSLLLGQITVTDLAHHYTIEGRESDGFATPDRSCIAAPKSL